MSFDRAFDVVVSTGAFGHILAKDEPTLLGNIQRALRPGGRFVFPTAEPPSPRSPGFWLGHGFNAAMHVRNAAHRPPFTTADHVAWAGLVKRVIALAPRAVITTHPAARRPRARASQGVAPRAPSSAS